MDLLRIQVQSTSKYNSWLKKNTQKRVQNIQEEEIGSSTEECQSTLPQYRLAQVVNQA